MINLTTALLKHTNFFFDDYIVERQKIKSNNDKFYSPMRVVLNSLTYANYNYWSIGPLNYVHSFRERPIIFI